MSKTFNLEDFSMDVWIEQALAEGNHVCGYKDVMEEYARLDYLEEPEVGLGYVKKANNVRAKLYRLKKERQGLVDQVLSSGMTEKLEAGLLSVGNKLVLAGFDLIRMRDGFDEYLGLNGIPERSRGRQPRKDALTTEDYS